jgi:hypothetical protein
LVLAGRLVIVPVMPLVSATLEFVDGIADELAGSLWLQPASARPARIKMARNGVIDFISFFVGVDCRHAELQNRFQRPFNPACYGIILLTAMG